MDGTEQAVLVTGSNSGLGRQIAETLARRGHVVFAGIRESAGRNAAAADELRTLTEVEGTALCVVDLDVTRDESVEQAIREVVETAGRLDVVVNNAGRSYMGPLEAFTIDQARGQFEVNVFGAMRVNRAALPHMREQGSGLLIQIGSVLGRLALPFFGLYAAGKFALEGITEAYHHELAPFGIDATIVEPGTYPTGLGSKRSTPEDGARLTPYEQSLQAFAERFVAAADEANGDPQEVADVVAGLIEMRMGARPLRTVVAPGGQDRGPVALNETAKGAAQDILDAMGLASVLPAASAPSSGDASPRRP